MWSEQCWPGWGLADSAQIGHGKPMDTVELIKERSRALPAQLQEEALRYVTYLLTQRADAEHGREWAQFSAAQLDGHYCPADSIYDKDE
jgi:hypothetical protein